MSARIADDPTADNLKDMPLGDGSRARIAIFSMGSRGDMQPLISILLALRKQARHRPLTRRCLLWTPFLLPRHERPVPQ
jgi:hypothetical protein